MSRKKVEVTVAVAGECVLAPEVQIGIYRLAQESLNNVAKHAKATRVAITLDCSPEQVRLVIQDDGRGFAAADVPPHRLGHGIMRERAEALGARLDIASEPGRGVRVTLVCPAGGKDRSE